MLHLAPKNEPKYYKLNRMKTTGAQHCILAGVLALVLIAFSTVHYLSHSLIELRNKLNLFDLVNNLEPTHGSRTDINETSPITIRPTIEAKRVYQDHIDIGEILPNCGLSQQCPDDTFAVHVFTGTGKEDGPRLCVLGKYVLGSDLNSGGRGINSALIDPVTLRVISVRNFDTYAGDSSQLEEWIQAEILLGDIVIFFTFDEASKELSSFAKKLIFELGSYRVQELHFRSQWFMLSQRGVVGFTPYEVIHAATHSRWADPINVRFCVPRQVIGQAISPDPISSENSARQHFCQRFNDSIYEEFCEASSRREPLTSALLTNRSQIGNPAYSSPWLVLAGHSPLSTFEGVSGQPGVSTSLVHVLYHPDDQHTPALAPLFGFHTVQLPKFRSRSEELEFGFKLIKDKYPDKKYVIVIEDDLLLSPDFLSFMAQLIPTLEKDRTLLGISSWNPNGYEGVSSDVHVAYRVEEFPGAGFLFPISIYTAYMEGKFNMCCNGSSLDSWSDVLRVSAGHMIVPDVSRVLLPSTLRKHGEPLPKVNIDSNAFVNRPQDFQENRYFQMIASLVRDSNPLHMTMEDLKHCRIGDQLVTSKIMSEYTNKKFVVYFQENPKLPGRKLKQLMYCFGIPIYENMRPTGMYKNLLRLTVNHNSVLLIEASSPFFKSLPSSVRPL